MRFWFGMLVLGAVQLTAADVPPSFYRGININGPALMIDGRRWEGKGAANFINADKPFENQTVPLIPPTDPERTRMLRSSTYTPNGKNRARVSAVPNGTYTVFLHVWEDNHPATCSIFLNGRQVLALHNSGPGGTWSRLGPWVTEVTDGGMELTSQGGHSNWSGIEIWRGRVEGPNPIKPEWSAAQLHHFEGKVRPLLAARCYECHSAQAGQVKGGLLLDNRANVLKGGNSGPAIVPGNPSASLLVKAVRYQDQHLQMPPAAAGGRLGEHEIEALVEWVRLGAPDPRDGEAVLASKFDLAEARKHWAYQPVKVLPPPPIKDASWPRGDLDRFVLARLEAKSIHPNPDADRHTLLRRATFDLLGLPPTPEQMSAFAKDSSPTPRAFAKVVDQLLASRHYGERWGRHWMDLVRYADTAGDNSDYPVPQLHLYRNYIIDSFNQDKPYNQFIREQIAGDLLPARDQAQRNEQVIATGYIAGARRFGSLVDRYPIHLTIEDTLDNLGRTFMGMTLACARCHDHKFEAISLEDYYGLYGIFASTRYAFPGIELLKVQQDFVPLISREEQDRLLAPRRAKEKELQRRHDAALAGRVRLDKEKEALDAKIKQASAADKPGLYQRLNELEAAVEKMRRDIRNAAQAIEAHKKSAPPMPNAYAVQDGTIGNARIQIKGEPDKPGGEVPRKFIDVLGGQRLGGEAARTSGRRELANWIADAANPLTARVMVNRVWQYHFGAPLVKTPSNFGERGLRPSHPELLDWLAAEFVRGGWSFKQLHRLMMNSRTYQLAGTDSEAALAADPNNELFWRFNRQRLGAEQLRDTLMFVSGTLDLSPATEPHPFPPMDKWDFTQHHPFKSSYPNNRRAVYQMTKRLTVEPYWTTFDGPDRNASTAMRDQSVTTVQSLYLLNSEFVHEQAVKFAGRMLADTSGKPSVARAMELALGKPATAEQIARAEAFLSGFRDKLANDGCDPAQVNVQSWAAFARVLFRLNEFLYVE